jgi:SPP1 gp7 family putative phage head morphogenesis protein
VPPLIVDVMTGFRSSLLRRETEQMQRMALYWRNVEQTLLAEMERVATELLDMQRSGMALSRWRIERMERYQTLLQETRVQLAQFETRVVPDIASSQRVVGGLGIDHAQTMIRLAAGSVDIRFNRLNAAAVENMVGLAGDGSPLQALLRDAFGDGMERMTQELVRGTALGRSPIETARRMAQGSRTVLNRTLTIARSETLRVYREASRQQYEQSGVVRGFRRLASKDAAVCAGCLMADGEFYAVQETLRSHPNCRCTMIPVVEGSEGIQWQLGPDWFRQQDAATQRSILGPGRYEAWQRGAFDLDQLVSVRRNSTWGDSVQVTPLRELVNP